jgi:large subunit ribosomal protein L24
VEKEAPLHISNVALLCDACAKPTRVGYKLTEDGKKVRYCKKCNQDIDKG